MELFGMIMVGVFCGFVTLGWIVGWFIPAPWLIKLPALAFTFPVIVAIIWQICKWLG